MPDPGSNFNEAREEWRIGHEQGLRPLGEPLSRDFQRTVLLFELEAPARKITAESSS
jgi:hypothetical protein